jgi:hypothetical protein
MATKTSSSRSRAKSSRKSARTPAASRRPSVKKTRSTGKKRSSTKVKKSSSVARPPKATTASRTKKRASARAGSGARAITAKLNQLKRRGEKLLSRVKASVASDQSPPKQSTPPTSSMNGGSEVPATDSRMVASTAAMSG